MIVFDVDDTIAKAWHPVPPDVCSELMSLEKDGIKIAFASGKNASYLMGLARGVGIKNPLAIGENGCVLMNLEPNWTRKLAKRPEIVNHIEKVISEKFADSVVIQENQVEFTIFPKSEEIFGQIRDELNNLNVFEHEDVKVYMFSDAADFLPASINKGAAVREVKKIFNLRADEIIAVGDSHNDVPMADEAGRFIAIGGRIPADISCIRVKNIYEVFAEIKKIRLNNI